MLQEAMMLAMQPWQQMRGAAQEQAQSGVSHQHIEVDEEVRVCRAVKERSSKWQERQRMPLTESSQRNQQGQLLLQRREDGR